MIKKITVVMAVAAALAAGSASAQWYAGGSLGQSKTNYNAGQLSADLRAVGVTATGAISSSDIGLKAFAGYSFNGNFALEGGYFNMGRPLTSNGTVTAPTAATFSGKVEGQGVNLDAVGTLPLAQGFSLIGRLGAAYFQTKATTTVTAGNLSSYGNATSNKFVPVFGVGAQYDFTKTIAGRIEAQRFSKVGNSNTGSGDVDFYSAGIVVKF